MATQKTQSFPMLPVNHWWVLRSKFKQSIPGVVTDTYLASVLNIQKNSAQANVLPALKQLKLIDDSGKTLESAKEWRDDQKYPVFCQKLRKSIYPQELLDAFPEPAGQKDGIKSWFAHRTGTGASATNRMASIYMVLSEANPNAPETRAAPKKAVAPVPKKSGAVSSKPRSEAAMTARSVAEPPGIHINLQVHISADASPDQIDKVFASMAKHIYKD